MPFKQIFTQEQVLASIKYHSDIVTSAKIAEHMDCSMQTVNSLLAKLEKGGLVRQVNKGTEAHPAILWSRTAKAIQDIDNPDES